jgi:hypothetical protein
VLVVVFGAATTFSLADCNKRFVGMYRLCLQGKSEYGSDILLLNVDNSLQDHTASHLARPHVTNIKLFIQKLSTCKALRIY